MGELYSADDARRDGGFSIYYMGINIGAFLAPLVVGFLAQGEQFKGFLSNHGIAPEYSWHFGFAAAAVGMFFGLVWYVLGWKHLGEAGKYPAKPATEAIGIRNRRILQIGLGVAITAIVSLAVLSGLKLIVVTPQAVGHFFGFVLALLPIFLFPSLYFFGGFDAQEKKRLVVIMVLFFGAAVFWSVFEQAGSTLSLFAERNTNNVITGGFATVMSLVMLVPAFLALRWFSKNRGLLAGLFTAFVVSAIGASVYYLTTHLGQPFPSSFFQSTNALFIVALAPVFAILWTTLKDSQPSSPGKFTIGLLFVALGFGSLVVAANLSANGVKVSPLWLLGTYMLHTIGELALSPVGMSAMTKLAPRSIVGLVLGIWFLAASLGNFMAGFAASMYESMPLPTLFLAVTGVGGVATVLMAASIGPIRRMMARA